MVVFPSLSQYENKFKIQMNYSIKGKVSKTNVLLREKNKIKKQTSFGGLEGYREGL